MPGPAGRARLAMSSAAAYASNASGRRPAALSARPRSSVAIASSAAPLRARAWRGAGGKSRGGAAAAARWGGAGGGGRVAGGRVVAAAQVLDRGDPDDRQGVAGGRSPPFVGY